MKEKLAGMRVRLIVGFFVLFGLAIFYSPLGMIWDTEAAGTISGRAFQDFNANGNYDSTGGTAANPTAIDAGMAGITVTAYNAAGTVTGSATTIADGTYSLAASGTGPYRIEFTNIPAGYSPSGRSNDSVGAGSATNSGSTVFFVNDGNSANVNFGVNRAEEYCQNNPSVAICRFTEGASNGLYGGNVVLSDFPYWAGTVYTDPVSANYDNPSSFQTNVQALRIGTVFSLAQARSTGLVYASAFFKRHGGFGPGADNTLNNADDPGAIYVMNRLSNTVVNTFTVPGATTNSHDVNDYGNDNLNIGWNAVGRTSLGGMALADDESRLYVMNLENRTLYALNPATGAVITSQAVPTATVPTPGGTAANCAAGDVRPFAVKFYRGNVYVGITCSAESTQNTTNLNAYIYQVNPTTLAFGGSPLLRVPLNYARGSADPGQPAAWRPWITTVQTNFAYPQPTFADMIFDGTGVVLGIRDRTGDSALDYGPNGKRTGGDTLRACGTFGAWTLESNGRCGGVGTAPQNNGQGPGNGEFYFNDDFSNPANGANYHDEVSWGTLGHVPGTNQIITTLLDPISRLIDAGATFDGGLRWFNSTTGTATRAYRIYNGNGSGSVPDFGKANGLGDVQVMCDSAPVEIGNRVWNDTNGNGVQDAGEAPINLVTVQLWGDTDGNGSIDAQIGTATTNANGHYVFGGVGNTNLTSFACGTTPGSVSRQITVSSDDAEESLAASTVDITNTDLELTADGATLQSVGVRFPNLAIPVGATITNAYIEFTPRSDGPAVNSGSPTITIRGQNVDNAPTFAATNGNISGRTTTAQSVLWSPANWTVGTSAQTANLTAIVQALAGRAGWASGNAMAFIMNGSTANNFRRAWSFDGNAATGPRLVVQYTTPALCTINPNTNYEVRIPASNFGGGALTGFTPTTPNNDSTANGTSRDSDGIVLSGSQVIKAFTQGGAGANNHTYDFGFRPAAAGYSIGNRVWFDTNNDGRINSLEVGIGAISVSIFVDANTDGIPDTPGTPVNTMSTDSSGYYRFDGLAAGNYVIRINPSNFANGAALAGHRNTTGNVTGDVDSDLTNAGENGIEPAVANSLQTNGLLSNTLALGPGAIEPLGETDLSPTGQGSLDNQADMTVDFGFYCMTLSGTLWNDTGVGPGQNNNGILDVGETRIASVYVRLYNSAGVEIPVGLDGILGTSDDGPGGTVSNGSGNYIFRCLHQGQYRVVVGGNGGTSSTPTSLTPDDNIDNDDNGLPGTGPFNGRTMSNLVTLTPGNAGALGNNTVTNAGGSTVNPTLDFGFIVAPSFIKLEGFEVYTDGFETVINWATGAESDNLGFNVYREVAGQRELVNKAMIAGSSLKSTINLRESGENYRWVENDPKAGAVYYLEDIDLNGKTTLHGPISPSIKFSARSMDTKSILLSDLTKTDTPSVEKEIIGNKAAARTEPLGLTSKNTVRQFEIAEQAGVRISVKRDGWYRITPEQLAAAGFDPNSNRINWKLFADANEVPIKIGTDGSFEFFGTGLDTTTADTRIFYLVNGESQGTRLTSVDGGDSGGQQGARNFAVTTVRKDRAIYISAILNGDQENWFGPIINQQDVTNQDLTVNNLDTVGPATLRVRLQGLTNQNHQVNLRFNNLDLGVLDLTGTANSEFSFNLPIGSINEGANQIALRSIGSGNDISLVDTVSLTYPRRFVAVGDKLRFTVPAGQTVRVNGFTAGDVSLFEVTGSGSVVLRQITVKTDNAEGTYGFGLGAASADREILAIRQSETPVRVARNNPSSWNKSTNGAALVIIAPEALNASAQRLAQMRSAQGFKSAVVLIEDLYDEFTFGVHSPEAVRLFLERAATTWTNKPKYAVLFGDSSYDSRNYLGQTDLDQVPTKLIDTQFMETASDVWLADFNGDGIEDISIGRLPVSTPAQAEAVLNKLQRYDNQPVRQQRSNLLIADGGFENYNGVLSESLPADVLVERIERTGLTDAEMHNSIINRLNASPMVAIYTGHGASGIWASPNIFTHTDVQSLNNEQTGIYLMMTCLNGFSHNPYNDSLAELVLKKEFGGASMVWASSGSTYPDKQFEMTRIINRLIFNDDGAVYRAGDLVRATKQATTDLDVRRTWQLIGDPTMIVK